MTGTIYLQEIRLDPDSAAQEEDHLAVWQDACYWRALPFYRDLEKMGCFTFDTPVTFFVGENGCGKSTLIEALAVVWGFNAEGGSKNFNFQTRDTTAQLHRELRYVRNAYAPHPQDGFFLRAESFYNVASTVDQLGLNLDGYGGRSLHDQSHGESFLALVQNRFRGQGLYILDEPEAALSPMRQLTLLAEIANLTENQSQFIIATHSPILLALPGARIYSLDDGIREVRYEETEHYQVTKGFLNNPQAFLRHLI